MHSRPALGMRFPVTTPAITDRGLLTVPGGTDLAPAPVGIDPPSAHPSSLFVCTNPGSRSSRCRVGSLPRFPQGSGFVLAPGGQGPGSFVSLWGRKVVRRGCSRQRRQAGRQRSSDRGIAGEPEGRRTIGLRTARRAEVGPSRERDGDRGLTASRAPHGRRARRQRERPKRQVASGEGSSRSLRRASPKRSREPARGRASEAMNMKTGRPPVGRTTPTEQFRLGRLRRRRAVPTERR